MHILPSLSTHFHLKFACGWRASCLSVPAREHIHGTRSKQSIPSQSMSLASVIAPVSSQGGLEGNGGQADRF